MKCITWLASPFIYYFCYSYINVFYILIGKETALREEEEEAEARTELEETWTEEKVDASTVVKKVTNKEIARKDAQAEEADLIPIPVEATMIEEKLEEEVEEMIVAMVAEEEKIPETAKEVIAHLAIRRATKMTTKEKNDMIPMTAETASSLITENQTSPTIVQNIQGHPETRRMIEIPQAEV